MVRLSPRRRRPHDVMYEPQWLFPPEASIPKSLYSQPVGRQRTSESPDARAVLAFAATGAVSVLIVALVAGAWVRNTARAEAVADARRATKASARLWVNPVLANVKTGNAADVRRTLHATTPAIPPGDPLIRRKLWAADGTIVWSDEPRLEGHRYSLGEDERAVIAGNATEAEISNLKAPENQFERGHGDVLEVYTSVRAGDGTRYMYEEYLKQSDVRASGQEILIHFLPAMLVALLLLWAVQIPLARSMVRRLDDRRREREDLLRQAVAASDLERQRIARDLHDGVVQQVAGTSLALHAQASTTTDPEVAALLTTASGDLRSALAGLRSLVVEIYPANLEELGLAQAIDDLLDALRAKKVSARLVARLDHRLASVDEALVFRVAQEAVRNIDKHAHARNVTVTLESAEPAGVHMEIVDDGRGFDTAAARPDGHLGLTLIEDLVGAAGGSLEIRSVPGEGTTVTLEVRRDA